MRNSTIAELLYFTKYVEKWGSGIDTMNMLIKNAVLPEPIYEEIGSSFVVTFRKGVGQKNGGLNEGLNGGLNEGLNEGLKSLYLAVKKNPGIKAKELSLVLENRSIKTIERQIKKLSELRLIEHRGSRKTGGYWIIESVK